ncbi:MAG: hypothetical protein A3G02_02115 [Candidatus Yanofskybacteria bacterium RIFCSPLOWO2_12_FULL_44_13b]|uniref:FAD-binding FR-type domain-containing protein n=2 Tax=Candidatus Yanofskyibacteriota TaxID=1752733 RepID=A0A1F8GZ58_9BACT|nr:MAG: Oxidoreductase FAD/NAD(P)-binding domain protein [Candidatus Yanofskybacteria bacterium GW2011_GWA2_44_10]OGN02781.1 MAG: hypothetical protein A2657_01400 [Candidatus Yanofskybacteria bacterium RIFCSPHIGHO2_01_FULL_44_110b]OGN14654.1 MAG: hypothetical protein A3C01_03145 [Candidatus Yanofskybacteria bacterium RIFCSPHIGHO2_02_FULL_44_36b]OGN18724.1 MAG: hypothetical protein A3F50_02325 [Candidatus Yanofskybacteria bacterium RIFCSPHIGHO2_12_FULL_44_29b]OGN26070.1 MAG: hypothetical protein
MNMYRLMLNFLIAVLAAVIGFSFFGILPYGGLDILFQTLVFILLCWAANKIFTQIAGIKPNPESAVITALILSLISGPFNVWSDWIILLIIAASAMASKYVLVWNKSHIFNPAAVGVIAGMVMGYPASWWIGSKYILPVILLGGYIVLKKIRNLHLTLSFLAAYTILLILTRPLGQLSGVFLDSAIIFFASVMLVEPLTSPQNKAKRIYFGIFVALALVIFQRLGLAYSLELSLLSGNMLSRILSPDFRMAVVLKRKEYLNQSIIGFWFDSLRPIVFQPGQYLEWTLSHDKPDKRGIRRYFTIASSPTEKEILLATRISDPGSTFKKELANMNPGREITTSKVSGDFILPKDTSRKLLFIAGGIGITPYRSMIKFMLDSNEKRDIILLYGARNKEDFVFRNLFSEAERIGLKNIYIEGGIDSEAIKLNTPDFTERIIYISGPEPMVEAVVGELKSIGVKKTMIKTDYFPGYEKI